MRSHLTITDLKAIIKELLENSLDANATQITIWIDNYGLDQIKIVDNGQGIPHSQLKQLGKFSVTSKLHQKEDLKSISTYGFRGEALASLITLSKFKLYTKHQLTNSEISSICFKYG
jgi:DNA mismatch repair ATPase MutL